jgi:hypothetical protein
MSFAIPFKLTVEHKRGASHHRFRGQYNWEEFTSILSHIYPQGKQVAIEYVDEEGDRVTVSSACEWEECVRLHANRLNLRGEEEPLRLRIFKKVKIGKPAGEMTTSPELLELVDQDARQESSAQGESEEVTNTSHVCFVDVPRLHLSQVSRTSQPLREMQYHDAVDRHVLDVLSELFECDAARELLNVASAIDFTSVVSRTVNAESEVHLDISTARLRSAIIVEANSRMEKGNHVASAILLEKALALFSADHIIEYNLACAYSLSGQLPEAFERLESAIQHGFTDYNKITTDEDLENLRKDDNSFSGLIARHFADRVPRLLAEDSATVAVEVLPRVAENIAAAPAVPTIPTPESTPSTATDDRIHALLTIFPNLSIVEAQQRIAAANGSVHLAANRLLGL